MYIYIYVYIYTHTYISIYTYRVSTNPSTLYPACSYGHRTRSSCSHPARRCNVCHLA